MGIGGDTRSPAASKGIRSECEVMNRPVGCLLLHGASLVPDGGVLGIWVLGRSPLGAGCGAFSRGGGVQSVSSPPCSAGSLRSKLFVRAQREWGTSRALPACCWQPGEQVVRGEEYFQEKGMFFHYS